MMTDADVIQDHSSIESAFGTSFDQALENTIQRGVRAVNSAVSEDGHVCFELEADVTIVSEYVVLLHFLGKTVPEHLSKKFVKYLLRRQEPYGGWPLVYRNPLNVSASVKAYYALKILGVSPDRPEMLRARRAILAHGGARNSNVFTRIMLALMCQVPWKAVPVMPVELMLLPKWFPFHISKISYWARTVLVPLLVVQSLKPKPRQPEEICSIEELFVDPPFSTRSWPVNPNATWPWAQLFRGLDHVLRAVQPLFPRGLRQRALKCAVEWVECRRNGVDGLGAIFPAMVNAYLMYRSMGYAEDSVQCKEAMSALESFIVEQRDEAYLQPCFSPVWDTALSAHALLETRDPTAHQMAFKGLEWLKERQIVDVVGDWAEQNPKLSPGGWAFQYRNAFYPDLDDTAVVVMAFDKALLAQAPEHTQLEQERKSRAVKWIKGLQSKNGGWGAFDQDNTKYYLNSIPFSDHGALLDPPTADVSARVVSMLAQLGETPQTSPELRRAVDYLIHEQENDGSWYGRWGMNFIYGTWSALCALGLVQSQEVLSAISRSKDWLVSIQNTDGGWGEEEHSYAMPPRYARGESTLSQTAWALLALMIDPIVHPEAIERGIAYLLSKLNQTDIWQEPYHTATGFPNVFYLRYHGYATYFPLWALARYQRYRLRLLHERPLGM